MPTLLSISQSEPFPMSTMTDGQQPPPASYKEIIKQLAALAPKPYGAIPPLLKKRKKKSSKHRSRRKSPDPDDEPQPPPQPQQKPMRRMSHVEDWIVVDSKESLPDEEELTHPFSTFLSAGFLTQVLPLHMPPPSLSDPAAAATPRDALPPEAAGGPGRAGFHSEQVQTLDEAADEEDEAALRGRVMHANWKSDGEEADDDDDDDDDDTLSIGSALSDGKTLVRRHSITSFSNAQTPSTSTTASYVMSSSPPRPSDMQQVRLAQTIAKLRWSLVVSSPPPPPTHATTESMMLPRKKRTRGLIPMPPPPRRPASQRRRSEATTKPRFNPETNTYTRDTRSNPDHLRIISAELNMIRARKLLSPLKPRGFLPRRKDPFIQGAKRHVSHLRYEVHE